MTISELARAAKVGVETIRYYQRRGLLRVPERRDGGGTRGGIRRYSETDAARLRAIRAAQGAGFTLDEIGDLIDLDAGRDRQRARALARRRLDALDAEIARLEAAREKLRTAERACCADCPGPCPIITAFEG